MYLNKISFLIIRRLIHCCLNQPPCLCLCLEKFLYLCSLDFFVLIRTGKTHTASIGEP